MIDADIPSVLDIQYNQPPVCTTLDLDRDRGRDRFSRSSTGPVSSAMPWIRGVACSIPGRTLGSHHRSIDEFITDVGGGE